MRTLPLVLVGGLLSASGLALAAGTVSPELPSCFSLPEPISGLTGDVAACAPASTAQPGAQATSVPSVPSETTEPVSALAESPPPVEFTPDPTLPLPTAPTASPTLPTAIPTVSPTNPTASPTVPTVTPTPTTPPLPTPTPTLPPGIVPTPTPTTILPTPTPTVPGGLGGGGLGGGLPGGLGGGGGTGGGSGGGGSGDGAGGGGGGTTSASFYVSLDPATVSLQPGHWIDVEVKLSSPASLVPVELTLAPEVDANALTALLDPLVVVLPAGDVRSATLRVKVPDDATPGVLEVAVRVTRALTSETNRATLAVDVVAPPPAPNAPAAAAPEPDAPLDPTSEPVQAEAAAEAPASPPLFTATGVATAAALTGAGTLGFAGLLLSRRETWRFAVAAFIAGLVARGRFDARLKQRVLDAVAKRPGITYGELKRTIDTRPLTLVAMLRTLERNRAIKAHRQGSAWAFSLPAAAMPLPKKRA